MARPVRSVGRRHLLDRILDADGAGGKALFITWMNTSFGLPVITWIGMPK